MKFKRITKILIITSIIGLLLLLYPKFSNYWNLKTSTKAINSYNEQLENIKEKDLFEEIEKATKYNENLLNRNNQYVLSNDLKNEYKALVNIAGDGMMGYVDIPSIDVSLPIYHGTSESILQHGIGHIEWSSLPVGGQSTHSVISGHRGLSSAKLFTDLDKIREGDIFSVTVLNNQLYYEVDQIRTVEPNDASELVIVDEEDYITLVTCTPYGINTHRLLVRGHRISSAGMGAIVIAEAVKIDEIIVAFYLLIPILLVLYLKVMLTKPKSRQK